MLRLPTRGWRTRLIATLYGLLVFIWMTPEDNAVWPVVALGAGLSVLLASLMLLGSLGGRDIPRRYLLPGAGAFGLLVGLGTAAATAGLMLFKNALHAHVFLDFPPLMMLAVLQRAPVWALVGGLCGLGLGLWMHGRETSHQ
jgi:hypothetical protein